MFGAKKCFYNDQLHFLHVDPLISFEENILTKNVISKLLEKII
jgi:hypothetical protein